MKTKTYLLSLSAAVAFFFVNLMGFVDTFTVSTEGCGQDYPFCNGHLYPDFHNVHAVIEYTHRLIVLIATILLVLVAFSAWRNYRSGKIKALIWFAIGGVLAEATLGALAVYFSSPPLIMAGHIGIALITFAALLNLAFFVRDIDRGAARERPSKRFVGYAWFTLVFLYLAIYFGAFVASSGAGDMFAGAWYPTETGSSLWIDFGHRLFALGLVLLTGGMIVFAKRQGRFVGLSVAVFLLVLSQAGSGILMVATHLNLYAILLHVTLVSLLFGFTSLISVQSLKIREFPDNRVASVQVQ